MSKVERKRNLIGGALLALVVVLLGVLIFQNFQASSERDTAQTSAATSAQQKKNLAEEVADACQSGQVVKSVAGVDLCQRAATIVQQPTAVEGPAGPRGLPGADGKDGATGATGKTGAAGKDGADGADGNGGLIGLTGIPGLPGLPGLTGSDGTAGTAGETGAAGTDGAPGVDGATGPVGPPGPAGESGKAGAAGEDGATGAVGPAGAAGTPGKDGAAGATGPAPDQFAFTDATGATYTCTPNPPGSLTYTCATAEPTP